MNSRIRAACGLLLALAPAISTAAEPEAAWLFDGELTAGYDSNVTRAAFVRDIVDDGFVSASLAAAWNLEFGQLHALTLRTFLEGDAFDRVDALDRAGAGVQGIFRWQDRFGFTVPFFQVSLAAQVDDVAEGLRDATRYTAQGFMTRRVTDALRYSVGLDATYQDADGKVFDTAQARAFVNADLALDRNWSLYGTYSAAVGDTVSSARLVSCGGVPAGDIYGLIDAADEVEADPALDDALCGDWLSYRLPAQTHVFVVGLNRGLGHSLSLDVSAQQVLVYADGNNEYQRTLVRAGILARF